MRWQTYKFKKQYQLQNQSQKIMQEKLWDFKIETVIEFDI
jgi:hypothetical protein